MRRTLILLLVPLLLGACSGADGREFARYYDPQGYFSVNLPLANPITVSEPRPGGGDGPGLLSGVTAQPPAPSPAPQAATSVFDLSQTEEPDRTTYQALAITTDAFDDLSEMGLFLLTGDPGIDVQADGPVRIAGHRGRMIVADVENAGQLTASVAVAMTLGEGGTGYVLAAVFPPGDWERERPDFLQVLRSFRDEVPPGLGTFPVAG